MLDAVAGLRANALEEARRLAHRLCGPGHQTIFFCNRRTSVEVLTRYLKQAAPALGGLYHCVAGGETSWHGYARFVIEWARANGQSIRVAPDGVRPIPTADYPTPAARPLNSRLSTHKLQQAFGLRLPDWQTGVERMLAEVLGR